MSTTADQHAGALEPAGSGLPERFDNPGLPEHRHRMADHDEAAARRAERQVATLFALSMIGTIVVLVGYFAVQLKPELPFADSAAFADYKRQVLLSNVVLGLGMFVALFGIGVGAVHWAKTLMPDHEQVEMRHPQRGTDDERAAAVTIINAGGTESQLGRRPLLRNTLIGALALFPLPGIVLLRDTGPLPGTLLEESIWRQGTRLVYDPLGGPIPASALSIGSVVHAMPEGIDEAEHPLEEKGKAAILLMRLEPADLDQASRPGSYEGIVAYSKICTHMGCPVALYEQQTKHLLCPCHQSTFDLRQNCKVIFGPAKRPLPQLPITVDDEGNLVASSGFSEAPGPSFWERG